MSPTIALRDGRPFVAVGAAGGATIITTVLGILVNRIDFGMTLPEAIATPRASQRNAATTQAEPDFMALPTTPGLQALGQNVRDLRHLSARSVDQDRPDDRRRERARGAPGGQWLAAAEPTRRGGGSAGVVRVNPPRRR